MSGRRPYFKTVDEYRHALERSQQVYREIVRADLTMGKLSSYAGVDRQTIGRWLRAGLSGVQYLSLLNAIGEARADVVTGPK